MGKVILGTSMSLDGFVNDRAGSVGALYADLAVLTETEPFRESIQNTGAVVMGRNSFAMADDPDTVADNYEYQVPIFVLTHAAPPKKPKENDRLTITFITDGVESAIARAKAAAGNKDVTIIGAPSTARQCLQAGLVDELHIDIVPVLLGEGLRFFDYSELESIQLERLQVIELPAGRTHLRYRLIR
jgi:dihydrofolate reductase